MKLGGADVKEYYNIFEDDSTDEINLRRTFSAVNSQILGSVTIVKKTGGGDPLKDAQFDIYQTQSKKSDTDDSFYTSREGVGTTLTDSYSTKTSQYYYKVLLGPQVILDELKKLGMYNEKTKLLTVDYGSGTIQSYKVHKENSGGETIYYYFTQNASQYSFEYIIGDASHYSNMIAAGLINDNDKYLLCGQQYSVLRRKVNDEREYYVVITIQPQIFERVALVEFKDLPLFNNDGEPIYYSVRETKPPQGFISLGDFNALTGMDLYSGYQDAGGNPVRDLSFEVENTRQMTLPVTGGSSLSLTAMIGSALMTLGGIYLVWVIFQKKRKKGVCRS